MIEWTITIGNIVTSALTLIGFIVAALGFFYALRSSINLTSERMLLLSGRVINIETELKELNRVIVAMAAQDERLASQARRLDTFEREASEWRTWVRSRLDRSS